MMSQKVPPNLQHTPCLPCHIPGAAWEALYVRGSPDTAEMIKPIKLQQTERRGNQCCPPEKGRLGRQDTEPELDWSWVEKALHSAPLAERAP